MTEYWLLKKQLGGWVKVSWWSEEEYNLAKRSYDQCAKPLSGNAWRLVKVEVLEESLLDDMTPETRPESEPATAPPIKNSGWGATPTKGGWGNFTSGPDLKKEPWSTAKEEAAEVRLRGHGGAGKVCLINHNTKERTKVDASEVDDMISQGWERGGPRTQFRS